jgi:transposase-like protein
MCFTSCRGLHLFFIPIPHHIIKMKTNLDKLSSGIVVHNRNELDSDIETAVEILKNNLSAYCPICEEKRTFSFIGTQRGFLVKGSRLYNCSECHATYSEETLRRGR